MVRLMDETQRRYGNHRGAAFIVAIGEKIMSAEEANSQHQRQKPKLDPPLTARNGHKLQVLFICRVSSPGPGKQDEKSLDDQEADQRGWLAENTELPIGDKVIAGTGSGEYLDREEAERAQAELETGRYDLVLAEDLGRIFRRMQAYLFCEAAEDVGTRVIARNDFVDTARPDWRLCAFFAAMRHELYNRDTALRIRRTLRNRFSLGGIFQCPIYGYLKPEGKKIRDDQVTKDPQAEPVYDEWFRKLEEGASYAEVADWLNSEGISLGPYCRLQKWDGRMVARVTHNPILKGVRVRNDRLSKRINRTGRRKSVKAPPEERLERECSHLAFIEPARYDRVIRMLKVRNRKYRRSGQGNADPCANRPKKRVRFPGQSLFCGICGRLLVFGGHGQCDHLMCSGAREHKCWNGFTVDGPLAAARISSAVLAEIEGLAGFDPVFLEQVVQESQIADSARRVRLREVTAAFERNDREIANLLKFIRGGEGSTALREDLQRLESEKQQLQYDRDQLAQQQSTSAVVVPEVEQVKQLAHDAIKDLAIDSYELGKQLRLATGKIVVRPFRLLDGQDIGLRAKFHLQLAHLLPDQRLQEALTRPLERVLVIDLFDPPQRVAFRERVMALRERMTERAAARELGITVTAAQRAAKLDRLRKERDMSDPYVLLTEPPADYPKLRRHLHARYHFEPLPGHDPTW
jgi:site-specific DNA recombinase